jgi:hypothetical protein
LKKNRTGLERCTARPEMVEMWVEKKLGMCGRSENRCGEDGEREK